MDSLFKRFVNTTSILILYKSKFFISFVIIYITLLEYKSEIAIRQLNNAQICSLLNLLIAKLQTFEEECDIIKVNEFLFSI